MKKITLDPIGIIHIDSDKHKRIPVQSKFSDIKGIIEIYEVFQEGLKDLEKFEYIICISYFDKVGSSISLQSPTHWGTEKHGVFAIRSPRRPNPIGFSIFKLLKIEGNIIHVDNLDLKNKTPVLDIKPFVPEIDNRLTEGIGWFKDKLSIQ